MSPTGPACFFPTGAKLLSLLSFPLSGANIVTTVLLKPFPIAVQQHFVVGRILAYHVVSEEGVGGGGGGWCLSGVSWREYLVRVTSACTAGNMN
jgi:hypothetical protein